MIRKPVMWTILVSAAGYITYRGWKFWGKVKEGDPGWKVIELGKPGQGGEGAGSTSGSGSGNGSGGQVKEPKVTDTNGNVAKYIRTAAKGAGVGLNNPGNLRSNNRWNLGKVGEKGGFNMYSSWDWGLLAMAGLIRYWRKRGLKSIRTLLNKWAPPTENNTSGYVQSVSKATNIHPDTTLTTDEQIVQVMRAMIRVEIGQDKLFLFPTSRVKKAWVQSRISYLSKWT